MPMLRDPLLQLRISPVSVFFIFFFAPFSFLLSTAMQITGPRAGLSSGSFWGIRFDFRTHVTQQERA